MRRRCFMAPLPSPAKRLVCCGDQLTPPRKAVVSQANRKQLRWTVHSDLIASQQPAVYGVLMLRLVFLSIAIVLSLLPVVAPASPADKRPAPHSPHYGFLPGYHHPPHHPLPPHP